MSVSPTAHLFSAHLLRAAHTNALLRPSELESQEISVYILGCLALLVFIALNWSTALHKAVQMGISGPLLRRFERKEYIRPTYSTGFLSLFFVLNLVYFAFSVNRTYGFVLAGEGFLLQLSFFILVGVFLAGVHWVLDSFLISITHQRKVLLEYRVLSWNIYRSAGLLLFPIAVLLAFSGVNVYFLNILGLVLLAALVIFRWIRGLGLCLSGDRIGILQILTYFCALEILPQLVLVKILKETF